MMISLAVDLFEILLTKTDFKKGLLGARTTAIAFSFSEAN